MRVELGVARLLVQKALENDRSGTTRDENAV